MSKTSLSFSYYLTAVLLFVHTTIVLCLLMASVSAALGALPEKWHATMEVPVVLGHLIDNYPVEVLDPNYTVSKIESRNVTLKAKPINNSIHFQAFIYLFGALYVLLFTLIIYQLFKILSSIKSKLPFTLKNIDRVKYIGLCILIIPIFDYFSKGFIVSSLENKFKVENGFVDNSVAFDFELIFMALVVLALADIFIRGRELQNLEDLTV